MITAKNAARKTIEANDKHKKRTLRKLKRQIPIWNLLTKIAIVKGETRTKITYRAKFIDAIFMEEAKLYLESMGYQAEYHLHWFDSKYTLQWMW